MPIPLWTTTNKETHLSKSQQNKSEKIYIGEYIPDNIEQRFFPIGGEITQFKQERIFNITQGEVPQFPSKQEIGS